MRIPARNIWDTRIQCVCGAITARSEEGVEIYASGCIAQVSISPPRMAINPNRLYPIEQAIKKAGRFAINVMASRDLERALELVNIRRREPNKAEALNIEIREDEHGIPYLPGLLRTVFCEVEHVFNTGDHTLFIGRVLESRENSERTGEKVLQYTEILNASSPLPSFIKFAKLSSPNFSDGLPDCWAKVHVFSHHENSPSPPCGFYHHIRVTEVRGYRLLYQHMLAGTRGHFCCSAVDIMR